MTIDNAALGKLASEATAGPWEWADSFLFNRETDDGVLEHSGPADYAHEGCRWPVSDADKAFIAAARTAVPDLLDQLDRAEAECERLKSAITRWEALGERHDLALREPVCKCQHEQGDSPCPVHQEES